MLACRCMVQHGTVWYAMYGMVCVWYGTHLDLDCADSVT